MSKPLKLNVWVKKDGTQIVLNNRKETETAAKKQGWKKEPSLNSQAAKQRTML
jgi:hypothetical protein